MVSADRQLIMETNRSLRNIKTVGFRDNVGRLGWKLIDF